MAGWTGRFHTFPSLSFPLCFACLFGAALRLHVSTYVVCCGSFTPFVPCFRNSHKCTNDSLQVILQMTQNWLSSRESFFCKLEVILSHSIFESMLMFRQSTKKANHLCVGLVVFFFFGCFGSRALVLWNPLKPCRECTRTDRLSFLQRVASSDPSFGVISRPHVYSSSVTETRSPTCIALRNDLVPSFYCPADFWLPESLSLLSIGRVR